MNCHSSDGRGGGKERTFILSKGPIGIKAWEHIRDEMVQRLQLQSSEVLKGYMRSPTSIRRSHGKEGGLTVDSSERHCGKERASIDSTERQETPWEGEGSHYRLHRKPKLPTRWPPKAFLPSNNLLDMTPETPFVVKGLILTPTWSSSSSWFYFIRLWSHLKNLCSLLSSRTS